MAMAVPSVVTWIATPLVTALGEGAAIATATFIVNAAASTALSAAVTQLSKEKVQAQERQASLTTLGLGEQPRQLCIGTCCAGSSSVGLFDQ